MHDVLVAPASTTEPPHMLQHSHVKEEILSNSLAHFGSILYQSEPLEVPYNTNKKLAKYFTWYLVWYYDIQNFIAVRIAPNIYCKKVYA